MFVLGFGQSKCFYTIKQCGFNGLTAENQCSKVIPLATNIGRHRFNFFFILGKSKLDTSAFFQPLNNLFRLCFALIFDNLFFSNTFICILVNCQFIRQISDFRFPMWGWAACSDGRFAISKQFFTIYWKILLFSYEIIICCKYL